LRRHLIAADVDIFDTALASGHLLAESIAIKRYLPLNCPAKSICSRDHGSTSSSSHGCIGSLGGKCRTDWHVEQWEIMFSMAEAIPGHHIYERAVAFVATMPWWLRCSILSISCRSCDGMTTRLPKRMQSRCHENASLLEMKGAKSAEGHLCGHPDISHVRTLDKIGSLAAAKAMSLGETGP
ncbi:hypothetical protein M513_04373, partial [Trichuris suis]